MSNVTDTWISARHTAAHPLLATPPRSAPHRDERAPWVRITMAGVLLFVCFFKLAEAILSGPTVERHGVLCVEGACGDAGRVVAKEQAR